MNFIKLSNSWFRTESEEQSLLQQYGCHGLLTLAVMCTNMNNNNTIIFRITDIYTTLGLKSGNTKPREYVVDSIKTMNSHMFNIYTNCDCTKLLDEKLKSNVTYYAQLVDKLDNNFFIIQTKEISTIVAASYDNRLEFGSLFTYFSYIIKNIGNNEQKDNYKVCYPSLKSITDNTSISKNTILTYNTILKNEKLLLIENAGKENDDKNIVNLYARYENKEQFDKVLKQQKEKVKYQYSYRYEQINEDKQRKLKQIINRYKKTIDINNITQSQWSHLNKLEREWYIHLTVVRNKLMFKAGLITIDMNGEDKLYYSNSNSS